MIHSHVTHSVLTCIIPTEKNPFEVFFSIGYGLVYPDGIFSYVQSAKPQFMKQDGTMENTTKKKFISVVCKQMKTYKNKHVLNKLNEIKNKTTRPYSKKRKRFKGKFIKTT